MIASRDPEKKGLNECLWQELFCFFLWEVEKGEVNFTRTDAAHFIRKSIPILATAS